MRNLLLVVSFTLSVAYSAAQTPDFGLLTEWGLVRSWGNDLSQALEEAGQGDVFDTPLYSAGWSLAVGTGGVMFEVTGARVSNALWFPPSGSPRTRFVLDTTELTVSKRWDAGKSFTLLAGGGVGVGKMLLQTYDPDVRDAADAWAATGQASFSSDWSPSLVLSSRVLWRLTNTTPEGRAGWVVGLGATASFSPLKPTWKLAGDREVSGLSAPWTYAIRPVLLVGAE